MSLSVYVAKNCAKAINVKLDMWLIENPLPQIADIKLDGRRVFLFKSKEHFVMASKHNGTYTASQFPDMFNKLNSNSILGDKLIFDGEFKMPSTLKLFDVLEANGINYRNYPLIERRKVLEQLVKNIELIMPYFMVRTQTEILTLKDEMIRQGYEGLMLKNQSSRYGQANSWLKLKKFDTVDVIILREEEGKEHAWHIGVYDKDRIQELGKVGSVIKQVPTEKIKIGSVVEVQFQEVTKDKKLRNPFIIRIRDDKIPNECLMEQI